ncbi:U-box domain-containing protein 11 [Quercus suber]|uniref:U-box domain-containing protein 11 n=1 Tax=Quercus suber TaxID=58331 RepID=UPI000CE1DBBF|nr:U-box domain-containing protein 11-like [Quercus suber]POE76964.1 u-box domain-containing protein 10 [Quercus suber]
MDVTGEVLLVLELVGEVTAAGIAVGGAKDGVSFRKDCTDLVRRISLLAHLLEEIREFRARPVDDAASAATSDDVDVESESWSSDLVVALRAAKRLLSLAGNFRSKSSSDGTTRRIASLFQSVTWKLEKALSSIPYDHFDISEEVQEQVELVRSQLRRATERYGSLNSKMLSRALTQLLNEEIDQGQLGNRLIRSLHIQNNGSIDPEASLKMGAVPESNGSKSHGVNIISYKSKRLGNASDHSEACIVIDIDADGQDNSPNKSLDEIKKLDPIAIPDDFLCPISLELMRDPVIVATGQTYERSFIQRWIDSGNATCPKTQQKLENFTLTPNYALRSLIAQWCAKHNIEQPTGLTNGKIKKSDGSFRDVSGDIAAIRALVRKLSSRSVEEHRTAAAEIRSLSKRSTDNRILIAESGGIPILVNLLTSEDVLTQENAVTSILNLSIYENNKGLIMLAGAIPSIVQVLRNGSMEARENAAATLFSLSLGDENKIIIGASGAIPALVVLLQDGSTRGKKDAATALFNLCIYQGNKGRAVRAGIISALLKMLTDPSNCMVDEALTIMSVLASHHEAKVAIVKASTIPVLIDLLRTGLPRNKENAAAILLALCKRDSDNLACISRLGAVIPLTELAKSGTERAKRKATSLLEHLRKLQQL